MRLGATRAAGVLVVALAAALPAPAQQRLGPDDLLSMLTRIGNHVEQYYARAQSIVCLETVRLQPLSFDLTPDGRARTLVYELRIAWDPSSDPGRPPEANVVRQILEIDGRAPRPGAEPGCTDPAPVTPEPLALLLGGRRDEYAFAWAGIGRAGRRAAVMLDYKPAKSEPASITWRGPCVSISVPAQTRGRLWIDRANDDVLRLDERMAGHFEFRVPPEHVPPSGTPQWIAIERADASIRYRPVVFHDPEETLMLPESIQTLTVMRGVAVPRLRKTQTFSRYRRFITDARIVKDSESR